QAPRSRAKLSAPEPRRASSTSCAGSRHERASALTPGPSPKGRGGNCRNALFFSPLPLGEGPGVRAVSAPDVLQRIVEQRKRRLASDGTLGTAADLPQGLLRTISDNEFLAALAHR